LLNELVLKKKSRAKLLVNELLNEKWKSARNFWIPVRNSGRTGMIIGKYVPLIIEPPDFVV
jgi:hypothetical protein